MTSQNQSTTVCWNDPTKLVGTFQQDSSSKHPEELWHRVSQEQRCLHRRNWNDPILAAGGDEHEQWHRLGSDRRQHDRRRMDGQRDPLAGWCHRRGCQWQRGARLPVRGQAWHTVGHERTRPSTGPSRRAGRLHQQHQRKASATGAGCGRRGKARAMRKAARSFRGRRSSDDRRMRLAQRGARDQSSSALRGDASQGARIDPVRLRRQAALRSSPRCLPAASAPPETASRRSNPRP